ncbi:MAG TPA: hypothetical protein VNB23_07560 [Ramlibacter sp.]|nr:hypothetical protein [Ramlibacter sp.]
MAFTVTSSGRRLVMAVLLALAIAGLVVRNFAPDPSPLRDVGTLLLVLWLPAVGNLVAYLIRKIPARPSRRPANTFAAGSAFQPQLRAEIDTEGIAPHVAAPLAAGATGFMVVKGRHAFTARMERPLVEALAAAGRQVIGVELLHPGAALSHLGAGEEFHVVVGRTAVAKGRVVEGKERP